MKKYILPFAFLLFLGAGLFAQSPDAINYQGVARDATGNPLANTAIGLRFTIRSGSTSGTTEYQETQGATTNSLGLFNLRIGQGTPVSGTFGAINWGGNSHFIEVEMDPAGGSNYQSLSNVQLVSVPYALHATTVEIDQVDDADADPANELQTLSGSGADVTLSNGGGTVTVDVNDADADPTNELQTLTYSNDTLTLSGGNSVVIASGGGGQWTASGNDIYNSNTGNVAIGTQTALKLLSVESSTAPAIGLGNSAFNNVESGRLTFSEDLDNAGGDCGFQFHHDGSANSLVLVSGCFIPTAGDTAFRVTRNNAYTNFKNRIKVGDVNDPGANIHIKQVGTGTIPGSSGLRLENSNSTAYNQIWTDGTNLNFSLGNSRIAFISNTGTFNTVSDRRMKTNILSMSPVLSSVMSLNPVQYNYIYPGAENNNVYGFIAQDVEKIFPNMVGTSPGSDLLALPYGEFSVVAIKAIQEQQAIINDQQAQIDALKAQVEELNALKEAVKQLQEQR